VLTIPFESYSGLALNQSSAPLLCTKQQLWVAALLLLLSWLLPSSAMAMPSQDLIQDITTRFILTAPAEQLMCVDGCTDRCSAVTGTRNTHVL
jgi:hypothetical protein